MSAPDEPRRGQIIADFWIVCGLCEREVPSTRGNAGSASTSAFVGLDKRPAQGLGMPRVSRTGQGQSATDLIAL
jgi:hypothetical protein